MADVMYAIHVFKFTWSSAQWNLSIEQPNPKKGRPMVDSFQDETLKYRKLIVKLWRIVSNLDKVDDVKSLKSESF